MDIDNELWTNFVQQNSGFKGWTIGPFYVNYECKQVLRNETPMFSKCFQSMSTFLVQIMNIYFQNVNPLA